MSVWQKDKDVTDRYGVEIPVEFLDGEPLISVTLDTTADESLTVVADTPSSETPNLRTWLISGGTLGFKHLLIRAETPTRSFEQVITLWVRD